MLLLLKKTINFTWRVKLKNIIIIIIIIININIITIKFEKKILLLLEKKLIWRVNLKSIRILKKKADGKKKKKKKIEELNWKT
jgi:hypothetical protein